MLKSYATAAGTYIVQYRGYVIEVSREPYGLACGCSPIATPTFRFCNAMQFRPPIRMRRLLKPWIEWMGCCGTELRARSMNPT